MRRFSRKIRNRKAGGVLVEFALAGPVLLLLTMGAVDFGRAFYQSVTISNAAGTGAFVGAQNTVSSGHYDGMRDAAERDAQDIGAVNVTTDRFCACPDGTRVDCFTGTCAGYGSPRLYVRCRVEKEFRAAAPIPGVPSLFTVRREVFMRVQ